MVESTFSIAREFRNSRIFSLILGAYLIFLATMLITFGYKESFLYLNGDSYSWLDWPMFFITHLGDSLILVSIISLIIVRARPSTVLNVIITVVITGLLGQILKQFFFEGWDRPLRIFSDGSLIHSLPHYKLFHNSFPSGHSITVTSAVTILVLDIRPKALMQAFLAMLIILVTYSRIYLGAHFPGDVLAGIALGYLISVLIYRVFKLRTSRLQYTRNFTTIITILAIISLLAGIWLLRLYFRG
ncbi:MAG TPA: phosphatase PAP2 family protein [Lentimicrobium sp.]|nr:phosphatase PAP2 family protein [Lentimicrobium sp.]